MIKSSSARNSFLKNALLKQTENKSSYRNFLVYINKGCPLGWYNRVVILRYVVNKIRQTFSEDNESLYTGFIDIQIEAIESAATEDT